MKSKLKIFAPLALIVLVLIVDKIALIPVIRDACRRESTPMENVARNLERLLQKQTLIASESADRRSRVLFLGSSRSEIFQSLHPTTIQKAAGLAPAERESMIRMEFETRGIVRAADVWLQHVMADVLLRSEVRPDYLVVEVSPEMFNENNPHGIQNRIGINVYGQDLLWDLFWSSTGKTKYETGLRLAFLSYNFSMRPEHALRNWMSGKSYLDSDYLARMLLSQQKSVEPLPEGYVDYPIDAIPPDEYKKRFVGYATHLLTNDILRDYRFSETQQGVFNLMVDRLRAANINAVFWSPPVHPELANARAQRIDADRQAEITKKVQASGFVFVDVTEQDLNCKYWTDASHLSDRCAPETLQFILERASARPLPEN